MQRTRKTLVGKGEKDTLKKTKIQDDLDEDGIFDRQATMLLRHDSHSKYRRQCELILLHRSKKAIDRSMRTK